MCSLALLCCVGVALLSACGADSPTDEKEVLHVGLLTQWPGYTPLYVAEQYDLFPSPVEITTVNPADLSARMLEIQKYDVHSNTMFTLLQELDMGSQIKVIAVLDYSNGADGIVAHQNIATIYQLKDKRVAVEAGTVSHYTLAVALQRAGLNESDVELVHLTGEEGAAALARGEVDALSTWEPAMSHAASYPDTHVIFTSKEIPGQIVDLLVIYDDVAEQRSDELVNLLRGWERGIQFAQERNPDFLTSGALEMDISESLLQSSLDTIEIVDLHANLDFFLPDSPHSLKQNYEATADFMKSQNMLKRPVPEYDTVFDPSFIQEALSKQEEEGNQ